MTPSLKRALAVMRDHPLVSPEILAIAAEVEAAEGKPESPEGARILQLQEKIIELQMQILSLTVEPPLNDEQLSSVKQSVSDRLNKYKYSELLMYYNRSYFSNIDARIRQPIACALVDYANKIKEVPQSLWQNLALTGEQK